MRKRWRWAGLLFSLVLIAEAGPVSALDEDLDSHLYTLAGRAAGVTLFYDREAFLPINPLANMGLPLVSGMVESTPSATIRSSAFDPGLVAKLGGPAALLLAGLPEGTVPPWFFYADAAWPGGPEHADAGMRQDVPPGTPAAAGLSGSASAARDTVAGAARLGAAEAGSTQGSGLGLRLSAAQSEQLTGLEGRISRLLRPFGARTSAGPGGPVLLQIGGMESQLDLKREGLALSGSARGRGIGLRLLDGLVNVSQLASETRLEWKNPNLPPTVTRSFSVGAVDVLGVPAALGPNGFEFNGTKVPLPVEEAVNGIFKEMGLTLRTGVGDAGEGRAEIAALVVEFNGLIVPPIPGFIGGERDIARVAFGSSSLAFSSALPDTQGEAADAMSGSTGQASSSGAAAFATGRERSRVGLARRSSAGLSAQGHTAAQALAVSVSPFGPLAAASPVRHVPGRPGPFLAGAERRPALV